MVRSARGCEFVCKAAIRIAPGTGFTPQFHWAKSTLNLETSDTSCESLRLGLSYASKIIAKLVLVAELLTVECMEIFGPGSKILDLLAVCCHLTLDIQ